MNENLRSEMWNTYYAISADIEHGECFYDDEMLKEFHENLANLKAVSLKLYEENMRGFGEDNDY